jgi:hypothetical protein
MKTGTFMDIVGINYDTIKSLFKSRLHNMNIPFNEDALNDAFIKCAVRFGEKEISYDDAVKYFWVAFLNTSRNEDVANSKFDHETEIQDEIDEEYDTQIDEKFDKVCSIIESEFGKDNLLAFKMVICDGWDIDELIDNQYVDCSFKSLFKKMKQFAKKHIPQNI